MTTPTTTVLFGGLIAWGIYRRIRRNIGRQPLRRARIIYSLVIFTLVILLVFAVSLQSTNMLLGIGGGILLGAGLGFLGLRLTKFETTDEGHFYTPNTHIGVALSVLLVGRMIYRMWVLGNVDMTKASSQPQLFQSPLTYFILGLTLGYYLVYWIGLFVHLHDKKSTTL
jgi:hypothetical protein